jgi:hypothetical protein
MVNLLEENLGKVFRSAQGVGADVSGLGEVSSAGGYSLVTGLAKARREALVLERYKGNKIRMIPSGSGGRPGSAPSFHPLVGFF